MQFSAADFLLEPKARPEGASKQPAGAAVEHQYERHNRFASVYAQQRRNEPPAPAVRQTEKPAPQQREAAARNEPKEHSSAGQTTATSSQKTESGRPQSSVADGQESDASPQKQEADVDSDMQEQPVSGWAQMDPLLLQVIQANQGDAELNTELVDKIDSFLIDGMDALPQEVFANILAGQAGAAQSDTKLAGEAVRGSGQLQQLATQQLTGEEEIALSEESEDTEGDSGLELELGTSARALSGQLAQQAGDSAERAAIRQAGEVKTTAEPLIRSDSIQRTESLQQNSALRQLPGQPLNMQQPGWSKELTDKVMWMSAQNLKSAEIKMNPAELGRLEIRIQVGSEQTQVSFVSANASVRDSLDSQMHRLREMLAQQGMQDVDVNVSDQSADEHEQRQLRELAGAAAGGRAQEDEEVVEAVTALPQQNNGTDGRLSYYV